MYRIIMYPVYSTCWPIVKVNYFIKSVKRILAERVGYICSNPECRAATSGPHTSPSKSIIIGVAAHITAASPEGPRYDATLSNSQRKSPENGIWLCENCAKLIDSDVLLYSTELLKRWKKQAEEDQFLKISQATPSYTNPSDEEEKIALLKTLMNNVKGAGFYMVPKQSIEIASGSIGFRVFTIQHQEDIKLLDLIGGINKSRICIILKRNGRINLRVLDAQGNLSSSDYLPIQNDIAAQVTLTWHKNEFSFWWMEQQIIRQVLPQPIGGKWFALTSGIDIENSSNATYFVQGVRAGGITGLGLCASNKFIQSVISDVALYNIVLSEEDIHNLVRVHIIDVQRIS